MKKLHIKTISFILHSEETNIGIENKSVLTIGWGELRFNFKQARVTFVKSYNYSILIALVVT